MLVQKPDLLLLDEPTNHLDLAAIERLETFLAEYTGAFVLVSHDRAFIRAVCREIVELEAGKFVRYPFGYDKYVVERDARLERARAAYERQKEHVDKTEDFIRRNLAGQKTKQAQSRRKMLDKLERLERPDDEWQHAGKIGLVVPDRRRPRQQGDDPRARAHGRLSGRAADPARRDRQHLPRRQGRHRRTERQRQVDAAQDADRRAAAAWPGGSRSAPACASATSIRSWARWTRTLSLIDEIRSVRADLSPEAVRQYLAKFRFFGDDPFRMVRGLSGGERSRLAMAKIMLFPRNVLVLDEPTNHLDIPARETLEDALERIRRHADRRQPRSLLPRPRLHPPAGDRRRPRWRRTSATTATGASGVHAGERARRAAGARPPRRRSPQAPSAPAASREADKDRERERRRLARRVETLEADVSKLEAELAGRARRAWPQITVATGRSCTPWPIASANSTPCSPNGWRSGKPPAPTLLNQSGNILRLKDLTGVRRVDSALRRVRRTIF